MPTQNLLHHNNSTMVLFQLDRVLGKYFYFHGRGVEKDYEQAKKWFELGHVKGDYSAFYYLDVIDEEERKAQ